MTACVQFWFPHWMYIRVTHEDQRRASVYDILKLTGHVNAHQTFTDMAVDNPFLKTLESVTFSGQGERPTPVADVNDVKRIINLLPGDQGARFRNGVASNLIQYLDRDDKDEDEDDDKDTHKRKRDREIDEQKDDDDLLHDLHALKKTMITEACTGLKPWELKESRGILTGDCASKWESGLSILANIAIEEEIAKLPTLTPTTNKKNLSSIMGAIATACDKIATMRKSILSTK